MGSEIREERGGNSLSCEAISKESTHSPAGLAWKLFSLRAPCWPVFFF